MSYQPPPGGQPYGGYPQPGFPPPAPPTHGKATASLVLGIVSLVACGLFTGIPAMILGRQAKREITDSHGQLGGEGLATAGFVTGMIGTILSGLGVLLIIALFALGTAVSEEFDQSCTQFNSDGVFVEC